MMRAPLLMVAVFVPVAVLAGIVVGRLVPFIAVAVLGAIIAIPLGYIYVGLVVLLRKMACGDTTVMSRHRHEDHETPIISSRSSWPS
jgi:hypothetical protein